LGVYVIKSAKIHLSSSAVWLLTRGKSLHFVPIS